MKPNPEAGVRLKEAVRLHQGGELAQAEQVCREVLAADADSADAWNLLAIALCEQNQLDAAAQAAERATALRPRIPQFWLTRGTIEAERNLEGAAQASSQQAIKLEPRLSEAHYALARSLHRENRLDEAVAAYRNALRSAPAAAEIHYHLARALLWSSRWQEAMDAFDRAFRHDPQAALDRRECLDWFRTLQFESLPEEWHAEVTRFFRREDIDKSQYVSAGLNVLLARPAFRALRAAAEAQAPGPFAPDAAALSEAMRDELFGILLRDTLVAHSGFESLLTHLRRALLLDDGLRAGAPLEFLCDLALQCFNNEFVYPEDEAESVKLAALAREAEARMRGLGAADQECMRLLATVAMYRPLHGLGRVGDLLALAPGNAAFDRLLRRTVREVLEERNARPEIRVIGAISDEVSAQVRAQYEANPYPRWFCLERALPLPAADWIMAEVPGARPPLNLGNPPRMLVAGCGTGAETLALATAIAGVRVLAIDLSLASLAYARRKAQELAIGNVEFCQADILELGSIRDRFDIVYCSGVLHHLREPLAGLRILARLARPGGFLKLGLYSERARASVNAARQLIRQQGLAPTESTIRSFRQQVLKAEPDSPLRRLLRARDFFSMSECRDLLFHVMEHQFSLPQIEELARGAGLTPLGLSKQQPRNAVLAYRKLFPGDENMAALHNWDAVEAAYPELFLGMVHLWCRAPG